VHQRSLPVIQRRLELRQPQPFQAVALQVGRLFLLLVRLPALDQMRERHWLRQLERLRPPLWLPLIGERERAQKLELALIPTAQLLPLLESQMEQALWVALWFPA
jgi:hypothetical protein